MISCFKGSATSDFKTEIENTHALSYISSSNLSEEPKISKIVESFKQYDVYKYSAYRTAFKLRTIQKASKLHLVDLSIIESILKDYDCGVQSTDKTISSDVASNIICALYTDASKKIGFADDPNVMSRLFYAFLQNAFVEGENPLLLVQMKITFILFSSAKLSEKYKHMFYHCSSNGIMNKNGLQVFLKTLSKLAEIVGEQVTFGSHLVSTAIQNCLRYCKGRVTEKRFKKWLSLEPQTLVWLSTLHRLAISETTEHFVQCDYCQVNPVVGLRYRCLQCINYNLCQNCFLRGFFNKGHKEGHYMHEFCQPATAWQETKATFSAIRNKLPFTKCPSNSYLSFEEESLCDSTGLNSQESVQNSSMKLHSLKKTTATYLVKELTSIINQLDEQLKNTAEFDSTKDNQLPDHPKSSSCNSNRNSLQDLNSNLGTQLERLRNLLKCLKMPDSTKKEMGIVSPVPHLPFHKKDHFFESTPLNSVPVPLQSKENFSSQFTYNSECASEKLRNGSLSVSNHHRTFSCEEKENFAFSSTYNSPYHQTSSMSLELTEFLNNTNYKNTRQKISSASASGINTTSPKSLSAKINELNGDVSKLSPLYVYSSMDLEELSKSGECSPSSLSDKSFSLHPSQRAHSTFTLNKDGSLEIMEQELQAMLLHLEELLPQVSFLANDSKIEKQKVISALTEMEDAVQKLSHLSIELSTGSTDL